MTSAYHLRADRGRCASRPRRRRGCALLLLVVAALWAGASGPGLAADGPGAIILVGDVLPLHRAKVWNRITELAAEFVIVAAASDRPKLYGEFARRALERHGAFAELLPVAAESGEFGVDHRRAVADRAMIEKVREAAGVFFVGGAPQRLAEVLIDAGGSPNPLGRAIARAHANGAVTVGGIPGTMGLFTAVDAFEALSSGRIPPERLFRGLGLVSKRWFIDQHAFSPGRLAEVLVAMRQLGVARGMGIGPDTAAVIDEGQVEVVGDEGVLLIDLSGSEGVPGAADGFGLAGARLSYLEHGDRFDMTTLEVRPAPVKLDGFEIEPAEVARRTSETTRFAAGDHFAAGAVPRLLREVLDGSGPEAVGLASGKDANGRARTFRFRFHATQDTAAWLSVESGAERYTILDVGLDISPVAGHAIPAR